VILFYPVIQVLAAATGGAIARRDVLGGLIHDYYREAA